MGTVFEDSDMESGSQEECFVEEWDVFETPPETSLNPQKPSTSSASTQNSYNILSVEDIVATMVANVCEAQELIPVR